MHFRTIVALLLLLTPLVTQAEEQPLRQISREQLEDKIAGFWLGQLTGNYFGFPFELLYGKGDFKKTLTIATTAGLDSDNQPATLGALLGVIAGAVALPADFTMVYTEEGELPYYDTYVNHTRDGLPATTPISQLVTRIANVAEKAILAQGGEKIVTGNQIIYTLRD